MPGLAKPLRILIYLTHTLTTSSRNDYFIPILQMKRLLHRECLPNAIRGFNPSKLLPSPCSLPLLSRVILSQGRRANNQTPCTKTLLRPCAHTQPCEGRMLPLLVPTHGLLLSHRVLAMCCQALCWVLYSCN